MNNEFFTPFLLSLIAGLSTLIGTVFMFIRPKKINEFITFCLAFAFVIMTLISVFDLIPSSVYSVISTYGLILGVIVSFLSFVLGNLSIRIINEKISAKKSSNLYRVGVLSMISLLAHNIPEGVAVFMSAYADIGLGMSLCIAIMLHNIPEGIVISVPMYYSGVKCAKVFLYTLLSGLSEPFGALIGYIFLRNFISHSVLAIVLIFVAGLMINLAINDILKESLSYNKTKYLILGIISGVIIFVITSLV